MKAEWRVVCRLATDKGIRSEHAAYVELEGIVEGALLWEPDQKTEPAAETRHRP